IRVDDVRNDDTRIDEPTDAIALESLRVLADDFRKNGYDLRRLIRVIAASRVFRLDSRLELADESISSTEHEQLWAVFPMMRLRGEQVAGSLEQSAALSTRDARSNLLMRIAKAAETNDFLKRYGDFGEDEMSDRGTTIPQRLLLMNGTIVKNKTNHKNPLLASRQIAMFASTDERAIDLAYVAILSRHPTFEERAHFRERFVEHSRSRAMEDLCWTLINSTEFSWNH
ncbi:MAG TPA: DUF1553 domain-containing protein, partial [Pirellulales bacterium]|nr:DUF1553 domain-containing protein [Pirellulales bacterium]